MSHDHLCGIIDWKQKPIVCNNCIEFLSCFVIKLKKSTMNLLLEIWV